MRCLCKLGFYWFSVQEVLSEAQANGSLSLFDPLLLNQAG